MVKKYLVARSLQKMQVLGVIALILMAPMAGCKKSHDTVPNVAVDFYLYLNEPSYSSLNTVGNYVYVNGGNHGIIVYRKQLDAFAAYDRTCPYEPYVNAAIVEVDSSGLELVERHCGSRFNILSGDVTQGPSTTPVKQYAADWDGGAVVHVHN